MAKKPKDDDDKVEPYEVDILGLELARKSPHWLHPVNRFPSEDRKREIRDKNRNRHKQEQRKKKFAAAKAQAEQTLARLRALTSK